jgi:hypothetical protein
MLHDAALSGELLKNTPHLTTRSPLGRALMRAAEENEVLLHAPGGTETLTVLEVRYECIAVQLFHVPSEFAVSTGRPGKGESWDARYPSVEER